jgi:hypothetical protein
VSGLSYLRSRDYSPSLGRFLTVDPIGFSSGDGNLYRFVDDNPITWVDPSGDLKQVPGRDDNAWKTGVIGGKTGLDYHEKDPYYPRRPDQPKEDERCDPSWFRYRLCNPRGFLNLDDSEYQAFNRGCIGLCGARIGIEPFTMPQKYPGTKCFSTYKAAEDYLKQLQATKPEGTPFLYAIDWVPTAGSSGYPKPVQNGLPGEVEPNAGPWTSFDYLSCLTDRKGRRVWEHANQVFDGSGWVIHSYVDVPKPGPNEKQMFCVTVAKSGRPSVMPPPPLGR